MAAGSVRGCARCGAKLESAYRFCPGCALPLAGEDVLSTEIGAARHQAERRVQRSAAFQRALFVAGMTTMCAFVAGLGYLLFDRELLGRVMDPADAVGPETMLAPDRRRWEPEWVAIPAGEFTSGPPDAETRRRSEAFEISKFEVPNRLWQQFLVARGPQLRDAGVYAEAVPSEAAGWIQERGGPRPAEGHADLPVREITPVAAALFCEWLTERLGEPGTVIRLPTRVEWEYAARGADGRLYPWGDVFYYQPPPPKTGSQDYRPPRNVMGQQPAAVYEVDDDTSPFGVVAMGTNVSEMVLSRAPGRGERLVEMLLGQSQQSAVLVDQAGASYGDTLDKGETFAQAWNLTRTFDPRLRWVAVGLRLVRVRGRA